jgi:hypothetical protein
MTAQDETILGYLPTNRKIGLFVDNDCFLKFEDFTGKDSDLVKVALDSQKYFNEEIAKKFPSDHFAHDRGSLLKVPRVAIPDIPPGTEVSFDYHLHIFGQNKWDDSFWVPIFALRTYIRQKTNSPCFSFEEVADRYGYNVTFEDFE